MEKVCLLFHMQISEHGNAAQHSQSGQHQHAYLSFIQQPMNLFPYKISLFLIAQIHILQLSLNTQNHAYRHGNQLKYQRQGK